MRHQFDRFFGMYSWSQLCTLMKGQTDYIKRMITMAKYTSYEYTLWILILDLVNLIPLFKWSYYQGSHIATATLIIENHLYVELEAYGSNLHWTKKENILKPFQGQRMYGGCQTNVRGLELWIARRTSGALRLQGDVPRHQVHFEKQKHF